MGKIVDVAHGKYEIPLEDIVIDPLAMPVGADTTLVAKTLETISLIKEHYGLNTTLGASNVSFGMPDRHALGRCLPAYGDDCWVDQRHHGCPLGADRVVGEGG